MRKIFAVVGILVLGIVLSGCTKKDPSAGQVLDAGTFLRLQIWTAQEANTLRALAREFVAEARTPGLSMEVTEFSSDEDMQAMLVDKMAEGKGPDIVFTDGNWITENQEKLVPISDLDESFTPDRFRATFVRAAADALIGASDNRIYGVPAAVDSLAIFYNEEHLIDRLPEKNTPSRTWTDLRKDVEMLTQTDNSLERFAVSGLAFGRVDNILYGFDIVESLMFQMGVKFFSDDGTMATFGSTAGVTSGGKRVDFGEEAISFFTSFANQKYKNHSWNEFMALSTDEHRNFLPFVNGKVSMVLGYSRDWKRIQNILSGERNSLSNPIDIDNVRIAFLPQFEDSNDASTRRVVGKVWSWVVPRSAKDSDVAWRFLKYMAKKENLVSFYEETGMPTSRLDLIAEQANEPNTGIFARQAKFASSIPWLVSRSEMQQKFEKMVQSLNNGEGSVKKALDDLEAETTDYLRQDIKIENALKPKEDSQTPQK